MVRDGFPIVGGGAKNVIFSTFSINRALSCNEEAAYLSSDNSWGEKILIETKPDKQFVNSISKCISCEIQRYYVLS